MRIFYLTGNKMLSKRKKHSKTFTPTWGVTLWWSQLPSVVTAFWWEAESLCFLWLAYFGFEESSCLICLLIILVTCEISLLIHVIICSNKQLRKPSLQGGESIDLQVRNLGRQTNLIPVPLHWFSVGVSCESSLISPSLKFFHLYVIGSNDKISMKMVCKSKSTTRILMTH